MGLFSDALAKLNRVLISIRMFRRVKALKPSKDLKVIMEALGKPENKALLERFQDLNGTPHFGPQHMRSMKAVGKLAVDPSHAALRREYIRLLAEVRDDRAAGRINAQASIRLAQIEVQVMGSVPAI